MLRRATRVGSDFGLSAILNTTYTQEPVTVFLGPEGRDTGTGQKSRHRQRPCVARIVAHDVVSLGRLLDEADGFWLAPHHHSRDILRRIGNLHLHQIHAGTLMPWIEERRQDGKAVETINHGLKIVRRILNLAATYWIDENGLTWLMSALKTRLIPDRN